jgi:hypothetical protein
MMRNGRVALGAVLACGALCVVGVAGASAAGEKVTTTLKVSPSKPRIGKSGKPVPIKFALDTKIAKPDGTRETASKAIDITYPKGIVMDTKGFGTCSLATLKANKPQECPKNAAIGTRESTVNAVPLFANPLHAEFNTLLLSSGKTSIKWGAYGTAKEVPTLHAVEDGTVKFSNGTVKVHTDFPRLPTAPGLPDGTVLGQKWAFGALGSKSFLRATKPCKGGWAVKVKYTFVDGSTVRTNAKASC